MKGNEFNIIEFLDKVWVKNLVFIRMVCDNICIIIKEVNNIICFFIIIK